MGCFYGLLRFIFANIFKRRGNMNFCITGLQWGDEGKGKVVDILAEKCDIVVRYSGGANAGHTVVIGDDKFALHLLPSGSVRPGTICVIGNGVVLDPDCVISEIETLAKKGITLDERLFISENAHVVLDYHKREDQLREESLGKNKIGTTIRGIGPCYADKIGRSFAVRMDDFRDLENLRAKLQTIVEYKNKIFAALYNAEPLSAEVIFKKCKTYADKLLGYTTDTTEFLHQSITEGKSVLFEGAQGALLDIDHGTFPFVTSSNASSLGMSAGCGVPAKMVDKFIGVVKAYSTRVGSGPFPTEQDNEIGQYIRDRGHEYGTTTGRPRRCGWFDAVAVAYTAVISSIDSIALMHLDTLAGLKEIKICRAYKINGKQTTFFPANAARLSQAECVYETVPGWDDDLTKINSFDKLPSNAKNYIKLVEKLTNRPITIIGVGPKRSQTIFR
jgi:adenylosuccinate synthase